MTPREVRIYSWLGALAVVMGALLVPACAGAVFLAAVCG